MLGKIDWRGTVALRLVVHLPDVLRRQRIGGKNPQFSWIPLVAIRTFQPQPQPDGIALLERLGLPNRIMEGAFSAMKAARDIARRIVQWQAIFCPIQRKSPIGDAVGITSHQGTKIGLEFLVAAQVQKPRGDVIKPSRPVRHI